MNVRKMVSVDGPKFAETPIGTPPPADGHDEFYMSLALHQARLAAIAGEVPVGAVIVHCPPNADPTVIALAHNQRETLKDPTAHAEILALRAAGENLKNWQLIDCRLYVTLEPCIMCAGALVNARIKRIVFGCFDPKAGAAGSLYNVPADKRLNHRPESLGGVLADEASRLLKDFFSARRQSPRSQ
jgi:tRNA(adenine34) deaminase